MNLQLCDLLMHAFQAHLIILSYSFQIQSLHYPLSDFLFCYNGALFFYFFFISTSINGSKQHLSAKIFEAHCLQVNGYIGVLNLLEIYFASCFKLSLFIFLVIQLNCYYALYLNFSLRIKGVQQKQLPQQNCY